MVLAAAAGAGAAIPAVSLRAASVLAPASWARASAGARPRAGRSRWIAYAASGAVAAALAGPWLVVVLLGCGVLEMQARAPRRDPGAGPQALAWLALPGAAAGAGGVLALAWVAFKVGALSYGGGFVIVPLMQHDAVNTYHWMSGGQFLGAVALGQLTPGPVVLTVAVVGFAAGGVGGGLLAVVVAFVPSFALVAAGARHFSTLRRSPRAQGFLSGAGPAALGAIAGAALPLGLELGHLWQLGVLALAAAWLLAARRGSVGALAGAALCGLGASISGLPIGR